MPTPDTYAPRYNTTQQPNFVRYGLAFSNSLAVAGKLIGSIPVGSIITKVTADVRVAFNAGTTNPISIGTTQANANELLQTGDITPGTVGYYTNARGEGMLYTATPQTPIAGVDVTQGGVGLWVKYNPTGTAPTQGLVVFGIIYIPPSEN